jgi:hypothetical protein
MVGLMVVEIGEGDDEKICDVGEDVKVGRLESWKVGWLDDLGCLLLGGFTGKLNCTREFLIN